MSRDGNAAEGLAATSSNLHLCARDVELRRATRVVDAELLDTEQLFARRNTRGNLDFVGLREVPRGGTAGEGRTNLLDLEPRGGAVSGGGGADLGHVTGFLLAKCSPHIETESDVQSDWALVVNGLVRSEGDAGAGSDGDGRC